MARGVVFKDSVWQRIMRMAAAESKPAQESHVKVGVLGPSGAAKTETGITMIELAAIHEFGSPAAHAPS